ncbi:MAG: GNAT family N-acetyltransferase [Clostridiales bacterium]|nr:GNAT family N-acetyltransferase [Clostridiales bacterium]
MSMTQEVLIDILLDYLMKIFECSREDLIGDQYKQIFIEKKFADNKRSFDILSMGNTLIVKATPERLKYVKSKIKDEDRDAVFSMPFIRGQYLHYIPKIKYLTEFSISDDYTYELVEAENINALLEKEGYPNALIYDRNSVRKTELAVVVKIYGETVGIASGCKVGDKIWQIGVDIKSNHRNRGLASFIVSKLTNELLSRGQLPVYDVISSNLNSQRVAQKVGYQVAWITDWKCSFEQ